MADGDMGKVVVDAFKSALFSSAPMVGFTPPLTAPREQLSPFHGLHQRGNLDCCEIGESVRDRIGQDDLVIVPHGATCVDYVGNVPFALGWFRPNQRLA